MQSAYIRHGADEQGHMQQTRTPFLTLAKKTITDALFEVYVLVSLACRGIFRHAQSARWKPILRTNLRFHILGVSTVAVAGVAGIDSAAYKCRNAVVSRGDMRPGTHTAKLTTSPLSLSGPYRSSTAGMVYP